jgi:hypothetical protein
VRFDIHGEFAGVVRVRALPGNVDHAVVNDKRRDEAGACGFALVIEFLHTAGRLRGDRRGIGKQANSADTGKE